MTLRKLFPVLSCSTLAFGLLLASPAPAQAAEVMCSNDLGSCTVSNDGQSFVSCSCLDNSSDEGSGGDEFAGLSEEELNVICLEHLAWCQPQMGEDGGEGTSTSDSGDPTGDGDGDTGDTTDSGEGEGSTTEGSTGEGSTTEGSTGDTAEGGDSGEGSTGEGSTTEGSTGDTAEGGDSGEGSTGDSGTTSEGDSGDGDGDSGSGSGEDSGGGQGEAGDGSETGTGGDSGGAGGEGDGAGCAVTTNASGFGLLMLSMLGLLGLRRREND